MTVFKLQFLMGHKVSALSHHRNKGPQNGPCLPRRVQTNSNLTDKDKEITRENSILSHNPDMVNPNTAGPTSRWPCKVMEELGLAGG